MKGKCKFQGKWLSTDSQHGEADGRGRCKRCGQQASMETSLWGVRAFRHPLAGEMTLSKAEVEDYIAIAAARYDRAWESMAADACGNGRHGYPKDWPGAYASSLKKQIFNEVGRKRGRDVIQAMRYRRFLM